MYEKLELCISEFSKDNEPGDYWYDCGVIESAEILSKFTDCDWQYLLTNLACKSIFWKTRLVECLGGLHNDYELEIILEMINTDDIDLFIGCVDSLRSIDITNLPECKLCNVINKLSELIKNASPPVKSVLENFMYNSKNREILALPH